MKKNRIIALGLEARANELRSSIDPQYSVRDIAEILTKESGQTVKHQSVQRYFELPSHQDPIRQQVQQRTAVVEQATADRLDAVQQLKQINDDALAILKTAKDNKTPTGQYLALAAIDRIQRQLELQAKLLGTLPTGPTVNITIVEQQYNEFRNNLLEVTCPECRARIVERLHQVLGQ